MRVVKFGIIGCGLMGREFASAAARWCHLTSINVRPEIVAISDLNAAAFGWFRDNFATIRQATLDYRELLANPQVEAVYCAVPHNLHRQTYGDIIEAGKHLFGEKPFGIDQAANSAILAAIARHPGVTVRCCSQFPFFPAMQRVCEMIEAGAFGDILEAGAGFLHSSDLDVGKPINWKRKIEFNGEYGVMGDLGMHVCHVPLRAGWRPLNVRAILTNAVPTRPDGKGGTAPCETWDNATLLCEAEATDGKRFPLTLKCQRIAPGELNTWYFEIKGMKASARFSTRDPQCFELLEFVDGKQEWRRVSTGYTPTFPTITGGIFEFGFTDAILQMWAAFLHELEAGQPVKKFAGVATPREAAFSHALFTAALESQKTGATVPVIPPPA